MSMRPIVLSMPDRLWYCSRDVLDFAGVTENRLLYHVREGIIPARKVSGRYRFTPQDVIEYGHYLNKTEKPMGKTAAQTTARMKKKCDDLWSEIVKRRAGYKSEISGREGRQIGGPSILNAHHMHGKPNLRLRYEIRNGICLTNGEHNFGIHNEGRRQDYETRIKTVRGDDWDFCSTLNRVTTKTDMRLVYEYLKQQLAELTT